MNRANRLFSLILWALLAGSGSGCATTAELERLRSELQAANERAAAAQAAADAATAEAQEARAASDRAGKAAVDARDAAAAMDQRFDDQVKKLMKR